MTFRCSYVGGEAAVGDEESTAVGWFALDALPDLGERDRERIEAALPERGETGLARRQLTVRALEPGTGRR